MPRGHRVRPRVRPVYLWGCELTWFLQWRGERKAAKVAGIWTMVQRRISAWRSQATQAIVETCLDGLGRLGGRAKIIRVGVCEVWIIWPREKPGKPPKSFFEFWTLLTRHRFFFFVPETLNPIFLGKSKKTRAGKWSRSVFSKNNLEPYDAIWCQFGSQFSSPKTRVYEYNQLIFSILTVFFFENPGTWTTSQKSSFFDKMASFFLDPHPHSDSHPCIGFPPPCVPSYLFSNWVSHLATHLLLRQDRNFINRGGLLE